MSLFFFEQSTDKGKSRGKGKRDDLPVTILNERSCEVCPLNNAVLDSPKMDAYGSRRPDVYILGEAPGSDEDKQGRQFVGKAGKFLWRYVPSHWKVRTNNTIQCHPDGNRDPTRVEIECCRLRVVRDIEATKPPVVIVTGNVPLNWAIGRNGITRWRGRRVVARFGNHTCWLFPIMHPSYFLRGYKEMEEVVFDMDMRRIDDFLLTGPPPPPPIDDTEERMRNIDCVTTYTRKSLRRTLQALKDLAALPRCALDIETQNLRPYQPDSRLLTCAIGTYDYTLAFPVDHEQGWGTGARRLISDALFEFLRNSGRKACHNLNFEQEWLGYRYGPEFLRSMKWDDTMSQAYVLDERAGVLSFDDLCLIHLGFEGKEFQEGLDMNHLGREPLEKVLPYNGHDTKYTDKLYLVQARLLQRPENRSLMPTYREHIYRIPALVHSQLVGMVSDPEAAKSLISEVDQDLEEINAEIAALPEVRKFKRRYHTDFDLSKDNHLLWMFRDILHREEIETEATKSGYTTRENVLELIPGVLPGLILEARSAKKINGTYLRPLVGKLTMPDGRVHGRYKDKFTTTSRLSMEEPNGQNWPRRRHRYVRRVIVAPKNHWIVSIDYGQIDARNIAMASEDERFIYALWHDLDIHMEWAEIFIAEVPDILDRTAEEYKLTDEKAATKQLRDLIKNKWVFPRFYGAGDEAAARYMSISEDDSNRLGRMFWDDFKGVQAYHDRLIEDYNEKGYVEMLTGRRCRGPMTKNELFNRPIQGATAEIVNNAMARLEEAGYPAFLNIHDDLCQYVPDERLEEDVRVIAHMMCLPPFDWITVPIIVEVKAGRNWFELEEVGVYSSVEFTEKRKRDAKDDQEKEVSRKRH